MSMYKCDLCIKVIVIRGGIGDPALPRLFVLLGKGMNLSDLTAWAQSPGAVEYTEYSSAEE